MPASEIPFECDMVAADRQRANKVAYMKGASAFVLGITLGIVGVLGVQSYGNSAGNARVNPALGTTAAAARQSVDRGRALLAVMEGQESSATGVSIKVGSDSGQLIFIPEKAKIRKGDTITWIKNRYGGDKHNVKMTMVPDGADADALGCDNLREEGEKCSVKFDVPGEYKYIDELYEMAGMIGHLTVAA